MNKKTARQRYIRINNSTSVCIYSRYQSNSRQIQSKKNKSNATSHDISLERTRYKQQRKNTMSTHSHAIYIMKN